MGFLLAIGILIIALLTVSGETSAIWRFCGTHWKARIRRPAQILAGAVLTMVLLDSAWIRPWEKAARPNIPMPETVLRPPADLVKNVALSAPADIHVYVLTRFVGQAAPEVVQHQRVPWRGGHISATIPLVINQQPHVLTLHGVPGWLHRAAVEPLHAVGKFSLICQSTLHGPQANKHIAYTGMWSTCLEDVVPLNLAPGPGLRANLSKHEWTVHFIASPADAPLVTRTYDDLLSVTAFQRSLSAAIMDVDRPHMLIFLYAFVPLLLIGACSVILADVWVGWRRSVARALLPLFMLVASILAEGWAVRRDLATAEDPTVASDERLWAAHRAGHSLFHLRPVQASFTRLDNDPTTPLALRLFIRHETSWMHSVMHRQRPEH